MKRLFFIFFVIFFKVTSFPIYIVTGANSPYFPHLLNLIGSLHKADFNSLEAIAVFDLGLTGEQRNILSTIQKVSVHDIEKTHPDVLSFFTIPRGGRKLGWYAWKPIAIKQALDIFPYVIWLDAGTTVLKPIDDLAEYVATKGYFLATIGDGVTQTGFMHDVEWGTTTYVRKKFDLDNPANSWILKQENIMACILGIARHGWHLFGKDWYELTYDLRNFADDGTTPDGFGTGRHDQILLSILGYMKGFVPFKQDYTQQTPFFLELKGSLIPFYITWNPDYVNKNTILYSSRGDLKNYNEYYRCIKFRSN